VANDARGEIDRAEYEEKPPSFSRQGCEGIVSKRLGSPYRSGRSAYWVKVKNPKAPAVTREAEEDWGR
jgi:ATP-dependent DNA ligase